MTVHTPGGSPWPARCAYAAAGLFSAASGITNLLYGITKGTDFGTSLVWGAVSAAVSIVFALSWPAVLMSADRKQWSRAAMAFIALLLTGTYSVSAALGSAMGGRTSAAIEAKDADDRKAKAQTKWSEAKAELSQLNAVKPDAELQALIDAAKAELGKLLATRTIAELEALMRRGCPARTALNGQAKASCPRYEAELARAWEKRRLTSRITELLNDAGRAEQRQAERKEKPKAEMDNAAADLAHVGPAKVANSDAAALAMYLQGLGLTIDADRVNKLLVLLAVLVIKCGGGLALAVGMALSEGGLSGALREQGTANGAQTVSTPPLAPENVQAHQMPIVLGASGAEKGSRQGEAPTRLKLLQMVSDAALIPGWRPLPKLADPDHPTPCRSYAPCGLSASSEG
jgi:hypothetical protein